MAAFEDDNIKRNNRKRIVAIFQNLNRDITCPILTILALKEYFPTSQRCEIDEEVSKLNSSIKKMHSK
ncbi:MAG: hypothetical protein ACUZ8H_03460 [Candidatus Anammoxibacter sp.]